jgi:alpha-L-fucosidase 2
MLKNIIKIFLITAFLITAAVALTSCAENVVTIACVGDSITEGYGLAEQSKTAYPVMLDSLLGNKYSVLNCGRSATTLQKKGNFPFWICKEFSNVFAFNPDIIIVMLGTNDTKTNNWNAANFEKDYEALIDTFKTISTNPKIYLCLPVPVFKTVWTINDSTVVSGIIPIIKRVAKKNNLPVIDMYSSMKNQSENYIEGIHPNEKGAKMMAQIIAKEIIKRGNEK